MAEIEWLKAQIVISSGQKISDLLKLRTDFLECGRSGFLGYSLGPGKKMLFGTLYGIFLVVQQIFDLQNQLYIVFAVQSLPRPRSFWLYPAEFRFPKPQHICRNICNFSHFSNFKIEFVGQIDMIGSYRFHLRSVIACLFRILRRRFGIFASLLPACPGQGSVAPNCSISRFVMVSCSLWISLSTRVFLCDR